MRRTILFAAVLASTLAFAVAEGAATEQATLVVDNGVAQCAKAEYATIQAAVDAASSGDTIRVCPGLYPESVRIGQPVTLKADPDAVEAVDCFAPSPLGDLDPTLHAILDPVGDGFSTALRLEADSVEVAGFVIEGASVGIDASDGYTGYRVHHNLIRLNTLFGVDFGGKGPSESRADHNCIRENRFGLVSELDDDSLWPANRGPENARDLSNARIDHNATFRNFEGIALAGPGRHEAVTIDHNVSHGDTIGIAIQNSVGGRIVDNGLEPTRNGILVGGANTGLEIRHNVVTSGQQGIVFSLAAFIDVFAAPTEGATIAENTVSGQTQDGFVAAGPPNAAAPAVMESQFLDNVTGDNVRDGIVLRGANADNTVHGNASQRNGRYGIFVQGAVENQFEANTASHNGIDGISLQRAVRLGVNYDATENELVGNVAEGNGRYGIFADQFTALNVFERNWMFGNVIHDADDDARPSNTWIGNQCATDFPAGTICGVG